MIAICAAVFLLLGSAFASCPQGVCPCPSGQVDVLSWMSGTYFLNNPTDHMASDPSYTPNENGFTGTNVYPYLWPQGSGQGKMWWSRYEDSAGTGYAWDVSAFDSNYIYFAYTNAGAGNDPNYYRQYYDPDESSGGYFYPAAPRCVTASPTQGQPYSNSTIILSASNPNDTQYKVVTNCSSTTDSLGGAEFQLWPPVTYTFNPPMYGNEDIGNHALMALVYRYDLQNGQYQSKEVFYYDQTYGWVAWTHQTWGSGNWNSVDSWDYMDQLTSGQLLPGQPTC